MIFVVLQEKVEGFSESGLRVVKIQHIVSNQLIRTFDSTIQQTIGNYELLGYRHTKARILIESFLGFDTFFMMNSTSTCIFPEENQICSGTLVAKW